MASVFLSVRPSVLRATRKEEKKSPMHHRLVALYSHFTVIPCIIAWWLSILMKMKRILPP